MDIIAKGTCFRKCLLPGAPSGILNLGVRRNYYASYTCFCELLGVLLSQNSSFESFSRTRKTRTPKGVRVFLARPAGFEPATYRFVAGHSIH